MQSTSFSIKNFIPSVGIWRPNQTVLLVYDGSFYVGVNLAQATTSYYGVTKLVNSVTSTATDLAAAAAAVKTTYDRNSWDSISLTNALAIAYSGTGATNAAAARTNLGIYATMLFSGTVTTGSTSFNYGNYNYYVIIGQPSSSGSRTPIIVPKAAITTSAVAYQISDESYYYSFNLYYSGVPAIWPTRGRNSSGKSSPYTASTKEGVHMKVTFDENGYVNGWCMVGDNGGTEVDVPEYFLTRSLTASPASSWKTGSWCLTKRRMTRISWRRSRATFDCVGKPSAFTSSTEAGFGTPA